MKKAFQIFLLTAIVISLFSCSMTFEKRRYRPGYHVDIVKNRNKTSVVNQEESVMVKKTELQTVILPIEKNEVTPVSTSSSNKKNDPVVQKQKSIKNKTKHSNPIVDWDFLKPNKQFNKKVFKPEDVKVRSKVGLILGLIFGVIALILLIVGFVGLGGGGWGGLGTAVAAFAGCIIAFIFALVLGLIKWKSFDEYKPVSAGFINAGFIMSIIAAGMGLLSFIFMFLIYPFGWIAIGMATGAILLGILSFSFGFRSLIHDKSLKTKMTIILGFLAVLFFILAMILLFI